MHIVTLYYFVRKHREGSDIKNLDVIFLDKGENRNPKTFVQWLVEYYEKTRKIKRNMV